MLNLQQVLSSFTLSDSMGITREEKAFFSAPIQELTNCKIEEKDAELIFDIVEGKEEVVCDPNYPQETFEHHNG